MVRGITNFIQQSSSTLLRPHKLQNTYLIIDGKNISFLLYRKHAQCQAFFGGDYDNYAQYVSSFFGALLQCKITPIVIFDGNNEQKKLATNFDRYSGRIRAAAGYSPALAGPGENSVYPLFLRTVFIDIGEKMNVLMYRCEFAADNDIANLAKELNCPVLSQDSDYFIYDVLYVTYNSLILTPRQNGVTNDYYLNCELYSCKYFLNNYPGLRWEHMTLLATVSGNDYIESDVFEQFYRTLCPQKGRAARMRNLINYLRNKSFDVALTNIMNSLHSRDKKKIALQIAENILGYQYKISSIPPFFDIKNVKSDASLTSDICATIDSLVGTVLKSYFSVDIIEEDRLDKKIGLLSSTLGNIDVTTNKAMPNWFLRKNRTCYYPPPVFEISCSIMYFLPAILEDYTNASVHSISYNIISALNKIMSQTLKGKEVPLKVVGRNDHSSVINKFEIAIYKQDIISLETIPNLTTDEKLDILFDVLNLKPEKETFMTLFKEIPSDWHLLFVCITYWRKNAKSSINDAHLCSILLSAIVLKILDRKVDVKRDLIDITAKYANVINSNKTNKSVVPTADELLKYQDVLESFSENESVLALYDLITKFKFNDGITFDRKIVHAFGELQSCIYFINSLNSLLEKPIEKILISECYNDTFLFNVYEHISKWDNMTVGLQEVLPHSVAASSACLYFYEKQLNILNK